MVQTIIVSGPLSGGQIILQAQSQEEESGAQQFERQLIENAAERWVSQKAAPVHDARGWAARCHIKGTQTAKVCAPLIGDREGFPLLRWYQAIARVAPLQSCRMTIPKYRITALTTGLAGPGEARRTARRRKLEDGKAQLSKATERASASWDCRKASRDCSAAWTTPKASPPRVTRSGGWSLVATSTIACASFNHPLILFVAFGTLWLSGTGFYLLFKSFSRTDVRWLRRRRNPAEKAKIG